MTHRNLYLALRWYLVWFIVVTVVGIYVEWGVSHLAFGMFTFLFGVSVMTLAMLSVNEELLQLVRYCRERHHEAKRKKRQFAESKDGDQ